MRSTWKVNADEASRHPFLLRMTIHTTTHDSWLHDSWGCLFMGKLRRDRLHGFFVFIDSLIGTYAWSHWKPVIPDHHECITFTLYSLRGVWMLTGLLHMSCDCGGEFQNSKSSICIPSQHILLFPNPEWRVLQAPPGAIRGWAGHARPSFRSHGYVGGGQGSHRYMAAWEEWADRQLMTEVTFVLEMIFREKYIMTELVSAFHSSRLPGTYPPYA